MFEECHQEKLLFSRPAFAEGMDDTRKRILKHYSNLNQDFLDEDVSNNNIPAEGASIPKVEVVGIEGVIDTLPAWAISTPSFFLLM